MGWLSIGRVGLVVTVAAVIAAATVLVDGRSTDLSPTVRPGALPGPQAAWRMLPPLPDRAATDVDGGAIAVAGGRIHVTVADRAGQSSLPTEVRTYRWQSDRWRQVGNALPANRGAPITLLGGKRPCVVLPFGREVSVWCASDQAWRRLGPPVFSTAAPSNRVALAGAFTASGRPYVLRAQAQAGDEGVMLAGRPHHSAFTRETDAWRVAPPRGMDPQAVGGTQRMFGFSFEDRPCVAYKRIPPDPAEVASVHVSCLDEGRWQTLQVPPLTLAAVEGSSLTGRAFIDPDGATAAGGEVYVGLDHYHGYEVDWPVFALRDGRWVRTALGDGEQGWNEQGSLHLIGGNPWAVRFDQRPAPGGLRTRLVVRALDPASGDTATVGAPLLADAKFYGPLYWGLAAAHETVYAMATVPAPDLQRNELRVFALEGHAVRSAE